MLILPTQFGRRDHRVGRPNFRFVLMLYSILGFLPGRWTVFANLGAIHSLGVAMSTPAHLEQSAVVLDEPGNPGTMRMSQVGVPPPGPGDIRLEVLACGLNPVDWKLAQSGLPGWSWPHVLGQDIVGIITDVGPDGDQSDLGRYAVVHQDMRRNGGLAESVVVSSAAAARLPAGIDATAAAAVPCPALTALQATERTLISPDNSVLIIGAAGAVGTFATQFTAQKISEVDSSGGKITAVTGPSDIERAQRLGADDVIDYTRGPLLEQLGERRFDVILDLVGTSSSTEIGSLLGYCGRLASVNRPIWGSPPFTNSPTLVEIALGAIYTTGTKSNLLDMASSLGSIIEMVLADDLIPVKTQIAALDEAPQLLSAMAKGELHDKPVIRVKEAA